MGLTVSRVYLAGGESCVTFHKIITLIIANLNINNQYYIIPSYKIKMQVGIQDMIGIL